MLLPWIWPPDGRPLKSLFSSGFCGGGGLLVRSLLQSYGSSLVVCLQGGHTRYLFMTIFLFLFYAILEHVCCPVWSLDSLGSVGGCLWQVLLYGLRTHAPFALCLQVRHTGQYECTGCSVLSWNTCISCSLSAGWTHWEVWVAAYDRFFCTVLEHMHLFLCLQAGHTWMYGWLLMTDSSVLS